MFYFDTVFFFMKFCLSNLIQPITSKLLEIFKFSLRCLKNWVQYVSYNKKEHNRIIGKSTKTRK